MLRVKIVNKVTALLAGEHRIDGADDEDGRMPQVFVVFQEVVEIAAVDDGTHKVLDEKINVPLAQDSQRFFGACGMNVLVPCSLEDYVKQAENFHFGVQAENLDHVYTLHRVYEANTNHIYTFLTPLLYVKN